MRQYPCCEPDVLPSRKQFLLFALLFGLFILVSGSLSDTFETRQGSCNLMHQIGSKENHRGVCGNSKVQEC